MPRLTNAQPRYTLHKASGLGRVYLGDRDFYLGEYGTAESLEAYQSLIAAWIEHGRQLSEAFEQTARRILPARKTRSHRAKISDAIIKRNAILERARAAESGEG